MIQPKVSIVLATYKPNAEYLYKQLNSIENQTYKNIELLICDDSGSTEENFRVSNIVESCMNKVSYKIFYNEVNKGSNKSFERLTIESTGDLISYCDQDDIWEIDKIERLVKVLIKNDSSLVYSDLAIINSIDVKLKSSFKKMNFRLKHVEGVDCFFRLIRRNSVTGCTMLIKSEIAKNACPFPNQRVYPHDHWLSISSSVKGSISYIKKPLVKYRIHGSNQIGNKRFINIGNLEEYYKERIFRQLERYNFIEENVKLNQKNRLDINKERTMVMSRSDFFQKPNIPNLFKLLKYIKYDFILITFEIIIFVVPREFGRRILKSLSKH